MLNDDFTFHTVTIAAATVHTLNADPSGDQVCTDLQWLLYTSSHR